MATVKFNCPHCGQRLGVTDKLLGQKIACPTCSGHIRLPEVPAVPSTPAAPPLPTPTLVPQDSQRAAIPLNKPQSFSSTIPITLSNGDITFPCPNCSCKLIVTERAAGKRIPCRKCNVPVTVPATADIPPDPIGRQTVKLALSHEEQLSVVELCDRLYNGNLQASATLWGLGEGVIDELLNKLESSLDAPRENSGADLVVDLLVKFDQASVKPLIARLGKSRRAYFALGRIGTTEALQVLIRELGSVNWQRVEAACIGLGLVERTENLPAVIAHLEHARKKTRVGEVYAAAGTAIAALQRRIV